jgi:hypothetical protein
MYTDPSASQSEPRPQERDAHDEHLGRSRHLRIRWVLETVAATEDNDQSEEFKLLRHQLGEMIHDHWIEVTQSGDVTETDPEAALTHARSQASLREAQRALADHAPMHTVIAKLEAHVAECPMANGSDLATWSAPLGWVAGDDPERVTTDSGSRIAPDSIPGPNRS